MYWNVLQTIYPIKPKHLEQLKTALNNFMPGVGDKGNYKLIVPGVTQDNKRSFIGQSKIAPAGEGMDLTTLVLLLTFFAVSMGINIYYIGNSCSKWYTKVVAQRKLNRQVMQTPEQEIVNYETNRSVVSDHSNSKLVSEERK